MNCISRFLQVDLIEFIALKLKRRCDLKKFKEMFSNTKSKVLAIGSVAVLGTTNAMAEIAVDATTGAVTGKFDMAPFMSGAAVILTAFAAIWVVKKVIYLFQR